MPWPMRFPASLREPQYRRYVIGNLIALNGMWAQRTVYAWLAWDLSGAASWVGVIAFLNFAPTLISGPIFGVIADRVNLKHAALTVQGAMLTVALCLIAADQIGALTLWVLAAASLASGVVMSAHHPVRMSLASRLVPRAILPNAIAIGSVNFNIARLAGPALGGALISGFGVSAALAVTAGSLIPQMAIFATLTPRERSGPPPARATLAAALTEGLRYAWRTPVIRAAMMLTGVFALAGRGVLEILPVIADGVFQRGAVGLGQLMAAAGAGALVAAAAISGGEILDGERLPRSSIAILIFGMVCVALVALAPVWPAELAVVAACGFCGSYVGITLQSVVQMNVEDELRGRVMSLWTMVGIGSAALGAIALGAAADAVGLEATLYVASAAGLAVAALILSTAQ